MKNAVINRGRSDLAKKSSPRAQLLGLEQRMQAELLPLVPKASLFKVRIHKQTRYTYQISFSPTSSTTPFCMNVLECMNVLDIKSQSLHNKTCQKQLLLEISPKVKPKVVSIIWARGLDFLARSLLPRSCPYPNIIS